MNTFIHTTQANTFKNIDQFVKYCVYATTDCSKKLYNSDQINSEEVEPRKWRFSQPQWKILEFLGFQPHSSFVSFDVISFIPTLLLVVRRFDDDSAQRVSLCRRMWLLSPKAEAQTRPHTVQADPCRVVIGCGWLRWWCLRARFATATSICCCSKVASLLSQAARHSSRSPANSSSLSKGIPHLLKDDLMWSLKRFFWSPTDRRPQESSLKSRRWEVCFQAYLLHGQATSVVFWVVSSRGMLCLLCGESQHEVFCSTSARAG